MSYELAGKVVLVTGAAGGIGAAVAHALRAAGARLALADLSHDALAALADALGPRDCLPLALDVTDAVATKALVARILERFGRLDIAFANAGISWPGAPQTLRTCDEAEFERIVEVNLLGTWRTVKACLPAIVQSEGQILVAASGYAFINGLANVPYAVSKAGIEMLARSLRAELGGTGASASVLYPGWVDTRLSRPGFGGDEIATRMIETLFPPPLRQLVSPQAVAEAVVEGLRGRRPRIFVPRRWALVWYMRGVLTSLVDRRLARDMQVHDMVRQLEERVLRPK